MRREGGRYRCLGGGDGISDGSIGTWRVEYENDHLVIYLAA